MLNPKSPEAHMQEHDRTTKHNLAAGLPNVGLAAMILYTLACLRAPSLQLYIADEEPTLRNVALLKRLV